MTKKILLFPLLLLGLSFVIISCSKSSSDSIDEEWKSVNDGYYSKVSADGTYNALSSQSNNGKVYWKESSTIADADDITRTTSTGKPEFTDTVVVRYEGWFLDKNGKKIIFDSTENPSLSSEYAYRLGDATTPDPNKNNRQFAVSGTSTLQITPAKIDGTLTILQDMKVGDEREVCVPQILGYGATGAVYTSAKTKASYSLIPAYTTLWFNIKLLKIIPMNGKK